MTPDLWTAADTWAAVAALIVATFLSEDLTCLATGLLAADGRIDPLVGVAGCFAGIFLGDLGLWLAGLFAGQNLLSSAWVARRLSAHRLQQLRVWLDRHCVTAAVATRFLPGTRLPVYLAAGALSRCRVRFLVWTAVAGLVWTPALVLSAALFGESLTRPLQAVLGFSWLALAAALGLGFLAFRFLTGFMSRSGRARLLARVSRLWRWEFWPSWLFYLPVLPWLACLSVRYRGMLTWTAANPGIPHGGVVGESKHEILAQLPKEWVVPSILVPPGELGSRVEQVRQALDQGGWSFPLILKPDVGQRGAGVRRVRNLADVEKYLREQPASVIAQTYHPGPYEAGIFYYRVPGEETGRIFSVTDKVFPVLSGDGRSTLEELIWRHPRYRMQARTFLARHDRERGRVLAEGESFALALAGNHCQGTMFRDGTHLITPELERTVDTIARNSPGFFIGRFDIRYQDVAKFRAGQDLAIVELNGVTSESTNLYDPSWSLLAAYRTLFRQWSLLYRIGHANRERGHPPTGVMSLLRLVFNTYRGARVDPLSD